MSQTQWILISEFVYLLFIIGVSLRIIWDTRSVSKTLAYLLLVIFVPVFGVFFYFSFGINYRKRKIYRTKLNADKIFQNEIRKELKYSFQQTINSCNSSIVNHQSLIRLLTNSQSGNFSPVFHHNHVEILVNGENLYPLLKKELKEAKKYIHIEFYIFENDVIGNEIKNILIDKAEEGVEVRFIYDDFGSSSIRHGFAREMKRNGIKVFPFNKIHLVALANRLNYRNHRKIVVIDGETSFVGGINISDKYINNTPGQLYWRDTHLLIKGPATYSLQHIFLSDWKFCSKENIEINEKYFPSIIKYDTNESSPVQIIFDGPDANMHAILHCIIHAVNNAKKEILITTPYYIPDDSLQQAMIIAALSGVNIKLLVPKKGDSVFVNMAAQSYFTELLQSGVQIFLYTKGFVHAKTFVADRQLASVGTANLDLRSFDLNFEVSALIYDKQKANQLADIFHKDIEDAEELLLSSWSKRSRFRKFLERIIRLFSPFL